MLLCTTKDYNQTESSCIKEQGQHRGAKSRKAFSLCWPVWGEQEIDGSVGCWQCCCSTEESPWSACETCPVPPTQTDASWSTSLSWEHPTHSGGPERGTCTCRHTHTSHKVMMTRHCKPLHKLVVSIRHRPAFIIILIVNSHNSRNVVADGTVYTTQALIHYIHVHHTLRTLLFSKMPHTAISHKLLVKNWYLLRTTIISWKKCTLGHMLY